jgi:hypothetical protein
MFKIKIILVILTKIFKSFLFYSMPLKKYLIHTKK